MQFNLTLNDQIQEMKLGDHICLIYKDEEEQMEAIIPYLKQGLERNEACVYIVDDRTLAEVKAALMKGGIDVENEVARGSLVFSTKREAYVMSGEFDPKSMLVFLRKAMEESVAAGFSGFRVTGEMTWALGNECGCERLIEYEALLNDFFPGSKATAICQYNSKRFGPEIIRDVLRTHPVAIVDGQVCANIYYETPRMVLGEESVQGKIDWMMEQLKNFRKIKDNLQSAVKVRDEFLSIASHELKTPLTSLKLQAQGLSKLMKKDDLPDDVFRSKVEKVMITTDRQVERLSKLVDDLLDVSQINAGKLRINAGPVNASELAESVIERFANQAKEAGVLFITKFEEDVIGEWDRFRIEQVISNILSNSLKYGQGKPVEITISSDEEKALISIKDSGIGISLEDQMKVFDRFERAIHANEVSGLGLGLYISKEIIESHKGSIQLESLPGLGSTFSVELPLHPAF